MNIIIMPIQQPIQRDCIIQNNTKYCEVNDFSKKDVGIIGGAILGTFLYIAFSFWISYKIGKKGEESDYEYIGLIAGIFFILILPCVIAIIYSLI